MCKLKYILCLVVSVFLSVGCKQQSAGQVEERAESKQAKQLLQGVWMDQESEMVVFKMQGDTVYFSDSTSVPAYFRVINDTLFIGDNDIKYPIVKQMPHVLWFKNAGGDVVKLVKSTDPEDANVFKRKRHGKVLTSRQITKTDTVVMYDNNRYHCYVAVNPSKYKVTKNSYNDDGLQVENVYYDNIIHLSIFQGSARVYSQDFRKQMFKKYVPKGVLEQSVLGNLEYDKVGADGFRFLATIGIPDDASCYQAEVVVSLNGKMSIKQMNY